LSQQERVILSVMDHLDDDDDNDDDTEDDDTPS
jgi:hypothetical protein